MKIGLVDGQQRSQCGVKPSLGIDALWKRHRLGQKNKALVEITLPKDAKIDAREYQLYLPSKDELQQKLMEWIGDRE